MTASPPRRYTAEDFRESAKLFSNSLRDKFLQAAEDALRLEQIAQWANEQARQGEEDRPWQWGYSDAQACIKGILASGARHPVGR